MTVEAVGGDGLPTDITDPTKGEVLVYNSTSEKWENKETTSLIGPATPSSLGTMYGWG